MFSRRHPYLFFLVVMGGLAVTALGLMTIIAGIFGGTEKYESGEKVGEITSDCFGDFKFDNLKENSGKYIIKVSHPDYGDKEITHDLKESAFTGIIDLSV